MSSEKDNYQGKVPSQKDKAAGQGCHYTEASLSKYVFDKPSTIQEGKERIARLRGEILDIEAQLGDRDRKGIDGARLSQMAFSEWRQRAKWSARQRGAEIVYLQLWIAKRQHNRIEAAYRRMQLDPESPDSLLAANYKVLRCLARERRVAFDEEEQAVLDATSRYFGPIVTANGKVVPPKDMAVTGGEDESGQPPSM